MNNVMENIPEGRLNNSFINRVRRYTRKCSFCNNGGHNVTTCDDTGLQMFYDYLIHLKDETLSMNNYNRILSIQCVEQYIYNFCGQNEENIKIVKSVACRFCYSRINSLLQVSVNKIIRVLYQLDFSLFSLHEYNFIPFGEDTPVRISSIIDGILLNYLANNETTETDENFNFNNLDEFKNTAVYNVVLDEEVLGDTSNTEMECSICYNSCSKINTAKLECNHEFCIDCTNELMERKNTNCPYCRNKIDKIICYNEESYKKLHKCSEN
jgi:hypothetical protein